MNKLTVLERQILIKSLLNLEDSFFKKADSFKKGIYNGIIDKLDHDECFTNMSDEEWKTVEAFFEVENQDDEDFIWIDYHRQKHSILSMDKEYLYNMVKCVWNNKIYPQQPFGEVISWKLNPKTHSDEYLFEAFTKGFELLKKKCPEKKEFIKHVEKWYGC